MQKARPELMPAITLFEQKVIDAERNVTALLSALNLLRAEAGLPPRPPTSGGGGPEGGGTATVAEIRPDTFYGKKLQTAVREYLEMRKAAAGRTDPATPKEMYEAITAGGYKFDAKTADIAMVGLRALLRKRTAFFHKLPNGTYGLTSWYPDAKKPKAEAGSDDGEDADDGFPASIGDVADDIEDLNAKAATPEKKAAAS